MKRIPSLPLYRLSIVLLLFAVALVSCAYLALRDRVGRWEHDISSPVVILRPAKPARPAAPSVALSPLVGQWYMGDHLGVNLDLTLSEDQTCIATFMDDLPPMAQRVARGTWRVESRNTLIVSPTDPSVWKREIGGFTRLGLVTTKGGLVLVP